MYPSLSSLVLTAFFSVALIDVVKTKTGDCSDLNLIKMNSCAVASQSSMDPSAYCAEKFGFNVRARDLPVLDLNNKTELQYQYEYEMCLCNGFTAVAKCWKYICPADENGPIVYQSAQDSCAKAAETNADGSLSSKTGPSYEIVNTTTAAKSYASKIGLSAAALVALVCQLLILSKRNLILLLRYWRSSLAQAIGAPALFMLLLYILQQADYSNQRKSVLHPPSSDLEGIYNCISPCINVMFSPLNENTTGIMKVFASLNAKRTGETEWKLENPISFLQEPEGMMGMVPVENETFIYEYALYRPNFTQWAITFDQIFDPSPAIRYQIWYNVSLVANGTDAFGRSLLSFLRGIDEAIISFLNDPTMQVTANLDVSIKDWPLVPAKTLSDTIVQNLGSVFFFCCVMIIFINVLNHIVTEKEDKLRHAMEMMGLLPSVYWWSYFVSNSILVFIGSLVTSVLGLAFGFKAFTGTNFAIIFLTFFLFGESMVVFAFFLSTIIPKSRTAILVGIFIFIIGLLYESFVFSSGYIGYLWWKSSTDARLTTFMQFFPFFNFGRMFLDITTCTTGKLDEFTGTFIPGPGMDWSGLYSPLLEHLRPIYPDGKRPDIPPPVTNFYFLLMNIAFYGFLTFYFDNVLPDEFGNRLPPWFFISKRYWFPQESQEEKFNIMDKMISSTSGLINALPDEDISVQSERESVLDPDNKSDVKVFGISKIYKNQFLACLGFNSSKDRIAVNSLFLQLQKGELLALLGQNGAGKTTSMNMMSGRTPPTSGDALIFGYSIKNSSLQLRKKLGICPQHDILFSELSAREHIQLYAGLKGIPQSAMDTLIRGRLEAVNLDQVADKRVYTYSGGMKRRLSLIISTIGDPDIMFLDEPTTGMDPVNRRRVWEFIERFKKDRIVVLTTHSMEEADILGDRIAIMAHGRICAIGDSMDLKSRFGKGYAVTVVAEPNKTEETKNALQERFPSAVLEDESAGALTYQFLAKDADSIPLFIRYIDKNSTGLIRNWGISQSTLEEVFLKIIRDANPHGYLGEETKKSK